MVERIKNKKGFTIIEVMVVIALIGILAAVLVPQFGGVKNRAKDAGMITNAKMVEAFVASEIDNWTKGNAIGDTAGTDDMIEAIREHFDGNRLTNPYTGDDSVANVVVEETASVAYSTGDDAGKVYVTINTTGTLEVRINGFDAKGKEIRATRRTITQ